MVKEGECIEEVNTLSLDECAILVEEGKGAYDIVQGEPPWPSKSRTVLSTLPTCFQVPIVPIFGHN